MGRISRHTRSFLLSVLLLWALPVLADPLRLATTTSTVASGLLDQILPAFTQETDIEVHVIAVGTGKALRMGADGDVDVVLVHAPMAEQKFVADGFGVDRRGVMYNEFLIVGPPSDPAGIRGETDAARALVRISDSGAGFVSRGDDSGTHKKELGLWASAGVKPEGRWYMEAGQGMGRVLQMAGELDAYTLVDEGTWLKQGPGTRLEELSRGDERLFNPYGIIAVNPQRHPQSNYADARTLVEWMTGIDGQRLIGSYRLAGKQLFTPSSTTVAGTIQ
jgi:tungstate transport system substrate-binding protein